MSGRRRARPRPVALLLRLASLHGVQLSHRDAIVGSRGIASPEAILAVLRALGVPLNGPSDVAAALRERQQAPWRRGLEPIVVAWDGTPASFELRLPAAVKGAVACRLSCENGEVRRFVLDLAGLPARDAITIDGVRFVARRALLPAALPLGYHRLAVEAGGRELCARVIAAPRRAYVPRRGRGAERAWGVFLPLHALRTRRTRGVGDLTDLAALMEWVAGLGGSVVATLPLLPAFLDRPFEPSPYSPVSRLFWNELYLDVTRIPEFGGAGALRGAGNGAPSTPPGTDRGGPYIDYRRVMAARRAEIEGLARRFFARPGAAADLARHLEERPLLEDYARFRAACERRRGPWTTWPARLRDGVLREEDYDEEARRYHLYAQWRAAAQFGAFASRARERGRGLYLDLPLGVHPDGFDVWRHQAVFAPAASGGAPPDSFFSRGQDWGFPPLHPDRIREQGYGYYIACVRHHMRHAGILRIDHVMGLHRLFWVPAGMKPREGVYVRYRAAEFYAILCLESDRSRTLVIGEDLGTVPRQVRASMARHAVQRMYVLQYELAPGKRAAPLPAPAASLAALNTHDLPTFAAFWTGSDVRDRMGLGLLDADEARVERRRRAALRASLVRHLRCRGRRAAGRARTADVLRACLAHLAGGPARVVVVNLEDLWGETRPQNTPGTSGERPNWRRAARHDFETFSRMPRVIATLRSVDRARRQEGSR